MSHTYDYVLIGAITADITPQGRKLGGTPSFAAKTAHAFDQRVGLLTSAGQAEPLLTELNPFAHIHTVSSTSTTTFTNIYTPSGRVQHVRDVSAPIRHEDYEKQPLRAPLVHIAPMAGEVEPSIIHEFADATTLLTPQGWMRQWNEAGRVSFKRWFEPEIVKAADIIVFSEEDIQEAPELEAEFARITRNLIVTRGEKGGTVYRNGRASTYAALPVTVTEPTGAGDIFAAAVLCSLPRLNHQLDQAVRVAAQLAAHSVTRTGIDSTPTKEEIQEAFENL
jgi:sugar/nucleoside kinase (ribokinase family)